MAEYRIQVWYSDSEDLWRWLVDRGGIEVARGRAVWRWWARRAAANAVMHEHWRRKNLKRLAAKSLSTTVVLDD